MAAEFKCEIENLDLDYPMYGITITFGKYTFSTFDGYFSYVDTNSFGFAAANGPESGVEFKYSSVAKHLSIDIDGDWGSFKITETLDENQERQFLAVAAQLKELKSAIAEGSPYSPVHGALPPPILSPAPESLYTVPGSIVSPYSSQISNFSSSHGF